MRPVLKQLSQASLIRIAEMTHHDLSVALAEEYQQYICFAFIREKDGAKHKSIENEGTSYATIIDRSSLFQREEE